MRRRAQAPLVDALTPRMTATLTITGCIRDDVVSARRGGERTHQVHHVPCGGRAVRHTPFSLSENDVDDGRGCRLHAGPRGLLFSVQGKYAEK